MTALRTIFLAAGFAAVVISSVRAAAPSDDLLNELRNRFAGEQTLCADFEQQRILKALSRPLLSKGEMVFRKGAGVLWRVPDPFPGRALVTASEVIKWDGDGPPRHLALDRSPLFRAITDVVLSLFAGDVEGLARSFTLIPERDGKTWRLTLVPKIPVVANAISRIKVTGAGFVDTLRVEEARGDVTAISFAAARTGDCRLDDTERSYFAR